MKNSKLNQLMAFASFGGVPPLVIPPLPKPSGITDAERNRRMKLAQTLLVKAGFLIYEYGKEKGTKGNWAIFRHSDGRFFGAQEIYNISLRRLEQFKAWAAA